MLAARIETLREEGGNPFMDYQLPQAVLQLKQGAGRLIRDESDRGVLVLCDPRLFTKAYGRSVRASLPPMKQTRELADVEAFFARIPARRSSSPEAAGSSASNSQNAARARTLGGKPVLDSCSMALSSRRGKSEECAVTGDVSDAATIARVCTPDMDAAFTAAVVSGAAEADFDPACA